MGIPILWSALLKLWGDVKLTLINDDDITIIVLKNQETQVETDIRKFEIL